MLTLVVMIELSWLVTVVALVLLPVFILPARRVGAHVGRLEREAAGLNAAMTSQMTERFSAPGATLVKLFGEPASRSGRVRPSGPDGCATSGCGRRWPPRSSCGRSALVSGLAQAVIYGLGGYLALNGSLEPGAVVTLALLLNRLYAPMTALATARLDIVSALVSFDRVFEVLDIEPLIQESPDAVDLPVDVPVAVEFDGVDFRYPSADQISLASLEEVSVLDDRVHDTVLHDISLRVEPGQTVALVGSSGAGKSTLAALVSRLYDVDGGAVRLGGDRRAAADHGDDPRHGGRRDPGRPPVPRHHPRQPALRPARRERRRDLDGAAPCPAGDARADAARPARHGRRRARLPVLGR